MNESNLLIHSNLTCTVTQTFARDFINHIINLPKALMHFRLEAYQNTGYDDRF